MRPQSMRLFNKKASLDEGTTSPSTDAGPRHRSLSPAGSTRRASLPSAPSSQLAAASAAAAAAAAHDEDSGARGREDSLRRRDSGRTPSPSIIKSLLRGKGSGGDGSSPHSSKQRHSLRTHGSSATRHKSDTTLAPQVASSPGAASFDAASSGSGSGGGHHHGHPGIRRLLAKRTTGVKSFLRKRKKSVPTMSGASSPVSLPSPDTQHADDLHLGTVAGHACACAHVDIVLRHNSAALAPLPADEDETAETADKAAAPGPTSAVPARGVLCHILHKCAVLHAPPRTGVTLTRGGCGGGATDDSMARGLSRSGDEDGDEFYDAMDSDCTPQAALAVSGPWDVTLCYGGSRYVLRVRGAGLCSVPAACLVAEVMRMDMEMGGAASQAGQMLDGLKLQDSVTSETFRMSEVLSRREAAGRTFWITQRGRLSQPSTPVGQMAPLRGAVWGEEGGDREGGEGGAERRSVEAGLRRRMSGLTGEFSMPGFDMDELKGPEMISETLGRASVWIPDKAPVGQDRFNCPATAIDKLEPGGELSNCWEEPTSETFMVRGKQYLKDGKKVVSQEAAYMLLGVDLLLSADQHHHVAARPGGFVQRFRRKAGPSCPFVLVLNFSLPWGSFIAYFAPRNGGTTPYIGDPCFDALMKRVIEDDSEGSAFRNSRLKIIPRCHDGPWLVRSTVGGKPAIIGTKITQEYFSGSGYFEVVTDVCSSTAALYILGVVKNYTKVVSVDLGFVIQGETEEELPERLIGAVRFHHLDVAGALSFESWESRPGAAVPELKDRRPTVSPVKA